MIPGYEPDGQTDLAIRWLRRPPRPRQALLP